MYKKILAQVVIGILDLWNASTYLSIFPKFYPKSSNSTYRPHRPIVRKLRYMNNMDSIKTWIQSWWTGSVSIPYIFLVATTSGFIQVACSRVHPRKVTIEKKDEINEKKYQKKRKSVPPISYVTVNVMYDVMESSFSFSFIFNNQHSKNFP